MRLLLELIVLYFDGESVESIYMVLLNEEALQYGSEFQIALGKNMWTIQRGL